MPANPRELFRLGRMANRLALEDRAIHDWYRFVLAFPPPSGSNLPSGQNLTLGTRISL